MIKLLLILIVGVCLEAVGVVFLSKGLKQLGEVRVVTLPAVARVVAAGVTNRNVLCGVFFEALFFGTLLVLMARADVSFVWPLTSLGFVVTTLAAHLVLNERVVPARWLGVLLIMLGAGLIIWTEKAKDDALTTAPAALPGQPGVSGPKPPE